MENKKFNKEKKVFLRHLENKFTNKTILNYAISYFKKVKTENMPYPLQLTLVIQGLYGLRFGDCIKCSFIPDRYDKLGMNIVYSITEVVHEIEAPTATWVTQIKTIARLLMAW